MIHTTENFYNKVADDIKNQYFKNELSVYSPNEKYHEAKYAIELFNNGVLSYKVFIGRLAKACNDTTSKVNAIVEKHIVSFGSYQYKPKNK